MLVITTTIGIDLEIIISKLHRLKQLFVVYYALCVEIGIVVARLNHSVARMLLEGTFVSNPFNPSIYGKT